MERNDHYILWLPSWYPNKLEPFNGDFIQRHAVAASLFQRIIVVYVVFDKAGTITNDVYEEETTNGLLTEKIIYYHNKKKYLGSKKLAGLVKKRKLYISAVKSLINQSSLPSLVHLHVAGNAGFVARWIRRTYNIPYLLTEHWTGFLPDSVHGFKTLVFYKRFFYRKDLRQAIEISAVSNVLKQSIQSLVPDKRIIVIPNVVNTELFYPASSPDETVFRFIHISGLDFQKNPEAILEAFSIVNRKRTKIALDIFGPPAPHLQKMVTELGLSNSVIFHGEVPQNVLSLFIRKSHGLILYSRYETFGCVIIEANACGVPVILSDLPVFHEIVKDGFNGVFVQGDNPNMLGVKIDWFMNNYQNFDRAAISRSTINQYNYQVIGQRFNDWYAETIKKVANLTT